MAPGLAAALRALGADLEVIVVTPRGGLSIAYPDTLAGTARKIDAFAVCANCATGTWTFYGGSRCAVPAPGRAGQQSR